MTRRVVLGTFFTAFACLAAPGASALAPLLSFGGEGTTPGTFTSPNGIAVVSTPAGPVVHVVDGNGKTIQSILRAAPCPGGTTEIAAGLCHLRTFSAKNPSRSGVSAFDVDVDASGNYYVVDGFNQELGVFDPSGAFVRAIALGGESFGIAIDRTRGLAYVTGAFAGNFRKIDLATGQTLTSFAGNQQPGGHVGRLSDPWDVAIAPDGDLYVSEQGGGRVVVLRLQASDCPADTTALPTVSSSVGDRVCAVRTWGGGALSSPRGIAVGADGTVFVADQQQNRLQAYTPTGTLLETLAVAGGPYHIAIDAGIVYLALQGSHRVALVSTLPPEPPVADAGPDTIALPGVARTFDGGASFDPDGSVSTWAWDFGDGSPTASGELVSHTFAAAGTFTVGLTVTDATGLSDVATLRVDVLAPRAAVLRMAPLVSGLGGVSRVTKRALLVKLDQVALALARGQTARAASLLASFAADVEALAGPGVPTLDIDRILDYVDIVLAGLV